MEITDVPGIGAFEGEDDENIAFEAAKTADLILFLISDLDEKIYEIRETRSNRSVACRNFEKLQRECQKLIQSIHSM